MHKREAYRAAFHNFDIDACAAMTDEELERLMSDPGLVRNRSKIFSMRKNAQAVKKIQAEYQRQGNAPHYSKLNIPC